MVDELKRRPSTDADGESDQADFAQLEAIRKEQMGKQHQEAQARLAAIVESSDDAIIGKTLSGIITSWNAGAEQIYGYSAAEAIGRHISLIIPPDRLDELTSIFERLKQGKRVAHFETVRVRKNGQRIHISITISPIKDLNGQVVSAATIARDITARKRAEQALAERTAALIRSNNELKQFAYVASHDLQEPLRMVTNYTQLLARRYKGQLDADADEFIQYAVDGAARMRQLIDGLLTYSRVNTQGDAFKPIDCQTVFDIACQNLRYAIEESDATVSADRLPTVSADETQLVQLFQNLIGNAIKYRGAHPPHIHIAAAQEKRMWRFSIQDNGIGIESQYFNRIFVIFRRLHSRTEYSGTGIGLALCKKIVEHHGGRIWVESDPGKGSTFYFTLPASQSKTFTHQNG